MKREKEYVYHIDVILTQKDVKLLFKALDFYACSNILFNDDKETSSRCSDLSFILKSNCIKKEF